VSAASMRQRAPPHTLYHRRYATPRCAAHAHCGAARMEHCPARGARARFSSHNDDDDERAALSVASYASLGLRAALARPRDATAAADELAALVRRAGRHVSGGVADEMAADCAAAGVALARCVVRALSACAFAFLCPC
jgi:hypothetical protein